MEVKLPRLKAWASSGIALKKRNNHCDAFTPAFKAGASGVGVSVKSPFVLVGILLLIGMGLFALNAFSGKTKPIQPTANPALSESENDSLSLYPKAPELAGISGYLNAPKNLTLESLRGKVVLVDFWTYTCINCIRTLPYLTSWYEKYKDKDFVIVGVHTPEFEFEKEYDNVLVAVKKYGINYPVVQDNDYQTWSAYQNHYWPHKYLVDRQGHIRYDHIGEGAYEETEQKIIELLGENAKGTGIISGEVNKQTTPTDFSKIATPEIYLGYDFARQPLGNGEGFQPEKTVMYALPNDVQKNTVYLEGNWKNNPDNMELVSGEGKIVLKYEAKNVNIVAGGDAVLSVLLDNQPVPDDAIGADVQSPGKKTLVGGQRLYNVIEDTDYFEKTLAIHVSGKGFRIYTFTFG